MAEYKFDGEKNTYDQNNICSTTAFVGWGFTVLGFFSYCWKLGIHILKGNINGQTYRDRVLRNILVPHFDYHPPVHLQQR